MSKQTTFHLGHSTRRDRWGIVRDPENHDCLLVFVRSADRRAIGWCGYPMDHPVGRRYAAWLISLARRAYRRHIATARPPT